MSRIAIALLWAGFAGVWGCTADVQTTDDSVKLDVEVPKVEVHGTPDLDPSTDHDVDIKTPDSTTP